jgi:flagellar biosynthesis anti-sigma factor FlgM
MDGIGQVNNSNNAQRIAAARANAASAQAPAATSGVAGSDQVEISPHGQMMSVLKVMPDIRIDKINEVRAAIERGDYETDEKLDSTIDEMLRDPDALGSIYP